MDIDIKTDVITLTASFCLFKPLFGDLWPFNLPNSRSSTALRRYEANGVMHLAFLGWGTTQELTLLLPLPLNFSQNKVKGQVCHCNKYVVAQMSICKGSLGIIGGSSRLECIVMGIANIRRGIKQIYNRIFGSLLAEREKVALRKKVMALPMLPNYPFDAEVKLLRSIGIKPSPMLDVGANTGIYSAIMEDIVGSDNLHMFEPLPHINKYLKRRFKRAHVFDFALSDKEGRQRIRVPYIHGQRIDTRATFNTHTEENQSGIDEIDVQLFPLDYHVNKTNITSIGFIKIDVEGHEPEVLNGALETLRRFKPLILIEIESRHHQYPITKIFNILESLGYQGFYVNPASFELLKVAQFVSDRDQDLTNLKSGKVLSYLNNFFFVHESSEHDFMTRADAFLRSEKRLVERSELTSL